MSRKFANKKRYCLKVTKSLSHVYVDLIDHEKRQILASSSTLALKFDQANVENCHKVGLDIGEKVKKLKINDIWFDRNSNLYHGRVKSLADGARESGLNF